MLFFISFISFICPSVNITAYSFSIIFLSSSKSLSVNSCFSLTFELPFNSLEILRYSSLSKVNCLSLIFSLSLDDVTFNLSYDYAFFKAVLITAIFATVYAFLIQTYMQQFTTASKTAIIFAMEPVSAAIFAYFMISETLTSIQLSGAVLIVLATIIAEVKFKRKLKHTL